MNDHDLFFIMNCFHGTRFRCLDYFGIQGQIGSVFDRGDIALEFKYVGTDFHAGSTRNTGIVNRDFRHIVLPYAGRFYFNSI
jgi:hypothetical protein